MVDEADSILIDEARIPLVIAGGSGDASGPAIRAEKAVRTLSPTTHFTVEGAGRNVSLTAAGIERVERALNRRNLFESHNLALLTAVQDALHARVLLRRDVDYVVQNGSVVSIDEFKGRAVPERRWPAGLQTAIEVKEGVAPKQQGRVLGSITIENLIGLYPVVCGMTGTAATQADELRDIYQLEVEIIPTNRPVVRDDQPDAVFATKAQKEAALVSEIVRLHQAGRPVLVGTASVEESERISRALGVAAASGPQRAQRRGRSGDYRACRLARRGHDFDQHGGSRSGHPARSRRVGARADCMSSAPTATRAAVSTIN